MSIFAITYPTTDTPGNTNGRSHEIAEAISELFDVVSCEYDDGLSFVRSDLDAESILTMISDSVEPSLYEPIYVMALSGNFAGSGTTKVMRALESALES